MPWCYYAIYICVHYELTMQRNPHLIWNMRSMLQKSTRQINDDCEKDLTRVWRHHQNLQENDWVSNWSEIGLNGGEIEDEYKAYRELSEDQISYSMGTKMQVNYHFASHLRRLWGIKTLLSCRRSTSMANTSSHDDYFGWEQ